MIGRPAILCRPAQAARRRGHRHLVLLAACLALSLPARGADWALLPASDPAIAAAWSPLLAARQVNLTPVDGPALVDGQVTRERYPVAVLAGGQSFLRSVRDEGDAGAALRHYVWSGGTLLVLASGRLMRTVEDVGGVLTVNAMPWPLAREVGLDRAGLAGGGAERVTGAAAVLASAGLPADGLRLPGEVTPLVLGRPGPGWRAESLLTLHPEPTAGIAVLARLEPYAKKDCQGRVVYAWHGLANLTGVGPVVQATHWPPLAAPPAPAAPPQPDLAARAAELLVVGSTRLERLGEAAPGWLREAHLAQQAALAELLGVREQLGEADWQQRVGLLVQAIEASNEAARRLAGNAGRRKERPMVEVKTARGDFSIELLPEVAPGHVANFLKLVHEGFYDGLRVHRVEPGFVVQIGCPYSREDARHPRVGTGGPGYTIPAEFNATAHRRGTVGMARSMDPDSAGSQFYICLDAAGHLDRQYTVFGQVSEEGMMVVDQMVVGDQVESMGAVDD